MNATVAAAKFRQTPRPLLTYLAAVAAIGFTIDGGIFSVLQNLYLLRLGFGTEFVGLFNSAGLFVFALVSLPIGAIRRWSNRQMLLIGAALIFAGKLGTPTAYWLPATWRASWLLSAQIVAFVGLSCFFVHTAPFVMKISPPAWRHRALAWQSATLSLAGFSGGLLAGFLPGRFAAALDTDLESPVPYQVTLLIAVGLFALTFLAICSTPEKENGDDLPAIEGQAQSESNQFIWKRSIWLLVGLIAIVRILQVAAPGTVITFANVFFDDGLQMPTNLIGIISAIGRLASVPVALATPWALRRWGKFRATLWITSLSILATLPMALSEDWAFAGIGFVLASGAGPLRYLAFLLFTLELVPADKQALISGAGEMAIGFGFALMAAIGGYLISWYGYSTLFIISIVVTLIGILLFWLFFQHTEDGQSNR